MSGAAPKVRLLLGSTWSRVAQWARARGPLPWWTVTAAVLSLGGERRSRRAALRGLFGVALTVAAPVTPTAARGDGPWRWRSRWLRSSDTAEVAAAVAFAVGSIMESRQAGSPSRRALPTVLTVLSWWLRRGSSAPVSVRRWLGGTAFGSLAALSTLRVWKVPPSEPAMARAVPERIAGHLSPDGAGLCVVVNRQAGPAGRGQHRIARIARISRSRPHGLHGTGSAEDVMAAVAQRLPAAEVLTVQGDLAAALAQAAGARAVGIMGGDGSVRAAAEVALRAGLPLAVIPGGTLNHFARDVGLSGADDTIEAVQQGQAVAVDVGMIDGRAFLNTASFGSYADLVDTREALEARLGKWLAMLVGLVRVLHRAAPVHVELDGEQLSLWAIFIGNSAYDPPGLAPGWRVRLDDGLFDVRFVRSEIRFSRVRLMVAVATGQLGSSAVYERRLVERLSVRSLSGPLRLAADGETFDAKASQPENMTVLIEKAPKRLVVYSPHRRRAGGN